MSIISEKYFNEQIKPEIPLLNLKDFVEVNIVDKKQINEDEFQKVVEEEPSNKDVFIKQTICPYMEPIDKMLSFIREGLSEQLNKAIGGCLIADMDTKTISELDCDKYFNISPPHTTSYSNKVFEFIEHLDMVCTSMTDGLRVRHILCDSLSFEHFRNCHLFQNDSLTSGTMFDKQVVWCSPLQNFETIDNLNILKNKVLPGLKPALFMLLAYSTEQALPVKLELTLPDVAENKMIEYYNRVTMVETKALEVYKNSEVQCLKEGKKRVRTLRLPILIGL